MSPRDRFRFAAFYFCYYAALGAVTPYLGRWVESLGHPGFVVGALFGVWYGTRIIGPPVWAWLSGRSTRPGLWFVGACVASVVGFAGFALSHATAALFLVMATFGFFYNALLPQFEAMTLTALGSASEQYGRIRLWGSVGFLLVAGSYGALMDRLGNASFPWITLPLLLLAVIASLLHRRDAPPAHIATVADAGHLWRRPGVRRFLIVAMLVQAGFGTFYVYYTLHLQAHGHDGLAVGILWAAGVLAEIAMFWFAPRLIARIGAARLLGYCVAINALRWAVTALFADSFTIMLLAQLTHACGFAVFQACCMQRMTEFFPGRRAGAGQSLLYGFSSGLGGVLGASIAAALWHYGRGEWAFLGGSAITALAWIIHVSRNRRALAA